MLREALFCKIHRATVTECHLDYVGSVTIDAELLRAIDLRPNEKVLIANCDNGERFETYVFEGEPGSGIIGINGAAAHKVQVGHKIIICAFAQFSPEELDRHVARVVVVDQDNRIAQRLTYPSTLDQPALTD